MSEKKDEKLTISMFPLPGVVLFPGMSLPMYIFEEPYKEMVLACIKNNDPFGIVYVKGNMCAEVGTLAKIKNVEHLEAGKMNVVTEGTKRFKIVKIITEEPYYIADVEYYDDKEEEITDKVQASLKEVKKLSKKALKIFNKISQQKIETNIDLPEDPNELLFLISANLSCSYEAKQEILEMQSVKERTTKILKLLKEEIKRLEILLENKKTVDQVETNGKLKL